MWTHLGAPYKMTQNPSVQVMGLERESSFSLVASNFAQASAGKNTTLTTFFLQSNKCIAEAQNVMGYRFLSFSHNTAQYQYIEKVRLTAQHLLC